MTGVLSVRGRVCGRVLVSCILSAGPSTCYAAESLHVIPSLIRAYAITPLGLALDQDFVIPMSCTPWKV